MRGTEFRRLIASLEGLTPGQREALLGALRRDDIEAVEEAIAERFAEGVHCPHCKEERVIRWGQMRGVARWRCRGCRRTFTAFTGTPVSHLRCRDRWSHFAESLRRGETLSAASVRCGIHINTAHRWRHRFLARMAQSTARLSGIAEADETFLARSAKGQPEILELWGRPARKRGSMAVTGGRSHAERIAIWIARDRSGSTYAQVSDRMDLKSLKPMVEEAITEDTILCTDGWSTYEAVTRQLGLRHERIVLRQGQRVRGPFHVQNVNNYQSRWKGWLRRFNGVSTKYLQNYVGWFRTLDAHPHQRSPKFLLSGAFAL